MDNLLEQAKNGEFDDNELIDLVLHLDRENQMLFSENKKLLDICRQNLNENQFVRIFEETKDFGRTQFVKEIQMQINTNKKLEEEIKQLKERIDKAIDFISKVDGTLGERHKILLKKILRGESNE